MSADAATHRVQPGLEFAAAPREACALRRDAYPPARHQERQAQKRERNRQLREQPEAAPARAAATAAAAEALTSGRLHDVIYADPPWRFEPYSRRIGMDRAADNH